MAEPEDAALAARLAASVEELEKQRALVVQLNALKNDLIAVLAHDIKGPLTSILGFSELLEEGYLEGEAATDAAKTIRTNAARLATLANDVLSLTRVDYGDLEIADDRVDLLDILKKSIEGHASERAIEFTCAEPRAYVRGDAERLTQAFDNLIRNAIKYSPGGEPVHVTLRRDGERYAVSIVDRGIGVPPEELNRLFRRFSRGTNARKAKIAGTGIGLFIVKTIIERHGGSVEARSSLGEGSTFDVFLPAYEATTKGNAKRVTLLTADANLSRFIAYELRTRGYRVRETSTLDAVAGGDLRAGDIVLVDDGAANPSELRAALPRTTELTFVGLGARSGAGWDRTLPKPFLVSDLLEAVKGKGVASVLP